MGRIKTVPNPPLKNLNPRKTRKNLFSRATSVRSRHLSMIPVMLFTIRLQDRHCTYRMVFSCSSYLQNQIVERADENHGGPLSIVVVFCPPKPFWKEIMVSQSGHIRSAFGCARELQFWFPRHYLVKVCVKKPLL